MWWKMAPVLYTVLLTACLAGSSYSVCPHQDHSLHLKRWSRVHTWPHGKPTGRSPVVISGNVLLDEQPPELHSINITSTGRLVWSPDVNITLRVKYIYINGQLDIGSEVCPFTSPARIVLTGHRGEFHFRDHMNMVIGGKVIVVADGGTVEIHGKAKLPWTKLTKTVPVLTKKTGIIFDHIESGNLQNQKYENGIIAYILHVDVHNRVTVKAHGSFELISTWQATQEKTRLINMIKNVTEGDILAMGIHYNLNVGQGNIDAVSDAFETLAFGKVTGKSVMRSIHNHDAYSAIVQKEQDGCTTFKEDISKFLSDGDKMLSKSALLPQPSTTKVSVESYVDQKHSWLSYLNIRVSTIDGAYPKLDVLDDTSTWQPGDAVVLTSTDYDWKQAEEATIVYCSDCTNKQIRVDLEAKYEHWGKMINRVDERGEVALLTRNIVIEGEIEQTCVPSNGNCQKYKTDTFGGHFKFLRGSIVHIEGAELYHMGQQTDVGRYPLHFHMGFDMRNMTHPPYIRENSIHHSFSRCVTVHGTHGVTVKDNVCYDTKGHAYFIEDGGEHDTVFDGNLAASVRKGSLIPSDQTPTCFWITSPVTKMRNNVAAGGQGHGIWYIYPVEPIGPSKGLGFFQPREADRTPITEFDNNVVHSQSLTGLFVDHRLMPDGSADQNNAYLPKENPLDPKSKDVEVKLYRLTAYKNVIQNAWLRGGWFHITQSSFADSQKSIQYARSTNQNQFVSNSVMIGLSENLGKPAVNWTRSLPVWYDIHAPLQGFVFYDGPVYGENIWFDGFISTELYTAGALSYDRLNVFSSSSVSGIRNAQFGFVDGPTTGNRVFDGDVGMHGFSRKDGDKVATNRDYDGSVTGHKITHVVKPWPFYVTPQCTYRQNWGMAMCPYTYGKLRLGFDRKYRNHTFPVMVRDDLPAINETLDAIESADFLVILGGSKTYTLHWTNSIPTPLSIYSDGLERNKNVRFGVCLPLGAKFDLYTYSPKYLPDISRWVKASSLQELDLTKDGTKYYHDTNTGMLYFNFVQERVRHANETYPCPGDCPMVTIKILQGNLNDGDCRSRLYHSTRHANNRAITIQHDTQHFGITMKHPPSNWGAGETKPFINRIPVNGEWGKWTSWGSCTLTCGGGQQERTRACDAPRPAHGGRNCQGNMREQRSCNTSHCPIDGGFAQWSQWSTCKSSSGCQGYKKRARTCTSPSPNYGGLYCRGSDDEVEICTFC